MGIIELLLIAIGLSMDAFAVSACAGLTMRRVTVSKAGIVGFYFGVAQALMPILGYLLATRFADSIITFDHWIAFGLLCLIGGKMAVGSFKKEGCADRTCPDDTCQDRECPGGKRPNTDEASLKPAQMLPLALATSVDALAVGVSFAFLQVSIVQSASIIGVTTFLLSMIGVKIGNVFGTKFKSKSELVGGIILLLIGVKILLEHTGILVL